MRVYLIRCEHAFKIGATRHMGKRLAAIKTHSPFEHHVLMDEPGSRDTERKLKKFFAPLKIHGEWFRWIDGVVERAHAIVSVCPVEEPLMKLGKKLRTKRLELDVTQAQAAQALGCTQAALSMIEDDKVEPGEELHGKIVRWLASGFVQSRAPRGARGPYKKKSGA